MFIFRREVQQHYNQPTLHIPQKSPFCFSTTYYSQLQSNPK
jgi:hypothetical protein